MTDGDSKPDEWHVDELDLDAYLARIGYDGPRAATSEVLRALHRRHVTTIRFENLDLSLGRGISTALADVQAKLVTAGRGGYCYEHGTLLGAVLERLGFRVVRMLARVGPDGPSTRPRSHLTLDVTADDGTRWLADTGFGSGLLEPLPWVEDTPQQQDAWSFRLVRLPGEDEPWRLQMLVGPVWETQYRFAEVPQHAADVEQANWFTSTNPRSPFLANLLVAVKDGERLWKLRGRVQFVERPDGTVTETELDDVQVAVALSERFGDALAADEIEALVAGLPEASDEE